MQYSVQIGASATIYMPSFINTGSAIQMLVGRYTDTQTAL
jgi:hypothetical protein